MRDDRLNEAIAKVVEGFDTGIFIRDTAKDYLSDWAVKLLPYTIALRVLTEHRDTVRAHRDKE